MTQAESTALALPDSGQFQRDIVAINQFQQIVHAHMVSGHDYGKIPGTTKPTLLKPGAEKIAKLLGLSDQYEIIDKTEDWDRPLFRYMVKCSLISVRDQVVISEGLGECNSMESKYRWRDAKRICPMCGEEGTIIKSKEQFGGGWLCWDKRGGCGQKWDEAAPEIIEQPLGKVPNDDIYSLVNTFLKMAKKRALVDAALSAGRLSDLFTQDIEELPGFGNVVEGEVINGNNGETETKQDKHPSLSKTVTVPNITNIGQLLTVAGKLDPPMLRAEVAKVLGLKVGDLGGITDLQGAWQTITEAHTKKHQPEQPEQTTLQPIDDSEQIKDLMAKVAVICDEKGYDRDTEFEAFIENESKGPEFALDQWQRFLKVVSGWQMAATSYEEQSVMMEDWER